MSSSNNMELSKMSAVPRNPNFSVLNILKDSDKIPESSQTNNFALAFESICRNIIKNNYGGEGSDFSWNAQETNTKALGSNFMHNLLKLHRMNNGIESPPDIHMSQEIQKHPLAHIISKLVAIKRPHPDECVDNEDGTSAEGSSSDILDENKTNFEQELLNSPISELFDNRNKNSGVDSDSNPSYIDEIHSIQATSSSSKKQRKARTAFTDHQLSELEGSFERQKYLSVQDRMELAARLHLSDMQVKTWYQNRRTKWKRQTAVGLELLAEAGNYAAVQRILQTNPYWTYHPVAQSLMSDMETIGSKHQAQQNSKFSPGNISTSTSGTNEEFEMMSPRRETEKVLPQDMKKIDPEVLNKAICILKENKEGDTSCEATIKLLKNLISMSSSFETNEKDRVCPEQFLIERGLTNNSI